MVFTKHPEIEDVDDEVPKPAVEAKIDMDTLVRVAQARKQQRTDEPQDGPESEAKLPL